MVRARILILLAAALLLSGAASPAEPASAVLSAMEAELARSYDELRARDDNRLYFIAYTASEQRSRGGFTFSNGALISESDSSVRYRMGDVEIRIGSPEFDNSHYLRNNWGMTTFPTYEYVQLPIADDADAIRAAYWLATDNAYNNAVERMAELQANVSLKVDEEDTSIDFSAAPRSVAFEPPAPFDPDLDRLRILARELSGLFRPHPWIYNSSVTIGANEESDFFVNSEGTRLVTRRNLVTIHVLASTIAEDGMELNLFKQYFATENGELPSRETIMKDAGELIENLSRLREAPIVEPYSGPAIMTGRAAGVFVHEIVGHRLEGHRNRIASEGHTFRGKVGERVFPEFISIYDDPTVAQHEGVPLAGHYRYDDEGVPAERVQLFDNGVLRSFLMSRKPVAGFPRSNGHGRRSLGQSAVARMANTIVESRNGVPAAELRRMLIEECRKQDKPYGYVFSEIQGGFTFTGRFMPQTFKVIPLLVTRVYADGRADELVRGVNFVGTPLSSLEQIVATSLETEVFNGYCGAESGWVPVSAVSPSVLIRNIEIEKGEHEQEKPPILGAPL